MQSGLKHSLSASLGSAFRRYPVTMTLVAASLLTFPVGWLASLESPGRLFEWMLFSPVQRIGAELYFLPLEAALDRHQWWRLLTPMFLHFSVFHLVLNLLWVWELGRRIELGNTGLVLLATTLVSSVCANLTQYAMVGPSFFGGMSGVVFGFLGFSLVWDGRRPGQRSGLNGLLYAVLIGFMLIGFTGLLDFLVGPIANGAHLGGFFGGAGMAFLLRLSGRWPAEPAEPA